MAAATMTATDGRALRATLKNSEQTIDDRLQQMTARAPFALLGTARGAYLAGYGAVFTAEVNLAPVAGLSPFRPAYTPQEIQGLNKQKREKLSALKAGMRQLLIEQVAIAVTLFNFRWEDTTGLPSQVVMQSTKQALLDLQARRAGPEAQERAIEGTEF
jgi:hypothetical protein